MLQFRKKIMALAILYLFKQGTQRGEFNGVKFQVCKGALNEGKNEYYATIFCQICMTIFVVEKGAYIKYARRPGGRGGHPNACRLVQGGRGGHCLACARKKGLELKTMFLT